MKSLFRETSSKARGGKYEVWAFTVKGAETSSVRMQIDSLVRMTFMGDALRGHHLHGTALCSAIRSGGSRYFAGPAEEAAAGGGRAQPAAGRADAGPKTGGQELYRSGKALFGR